MRLSLMMAALALAGCTPSMRVSTEYNAPAKLQAEKTSDLCGAMSENLPYHLPDRVADAVLAELERRGAVRPQFAGAIRANQVATGMNMCEMHAAWGLPEHVNRTVTAGAETVQFVYGQSDYAYSDGSGYVTAVQTGD